MPVREDVAKASELGRQWHMILREAEEIIALLPPHDRTVSSYSASFENDPISYFNKSANREQVIPELHRERKRAIIYP